MCIRSCSSGNSRKRVKFAWRYGPFFFMDTVFPYRFVRSVCRMPPGVSVNERPAALFPYRFFRCFTRRVLTPGFLAACFTV
jgi:hypothetical protein